MGIGEIIGRIDTWPVLKWIILILIAGFIGQFGRMLAQAVVRKIRLARLKEESQAHAEPQSGREVPSAAPRSASPEYEPIGDKKALKILAKIKKKKTGQRKKEAKKSR